jgi:archaeal flagellar protein FlaJ
MTSSKSSPKRSVKSYFEEISSFDLFYQLTYMSATTAAGISRSKAFQLARELPCPPAQYFRSIHEVAENLRYNYPDAVRLVGEQAKSEDTRTFLLRLSDALRSGEPLPGFLAREAEVQSENYANDYARGLESLKKWNDAYSAISVSAALIVIINMVSTMIYNLGTLTMMMMVTVAIAATLGVAWLIFRSGPQETKSVPLAKGSKDQQLARQLALFLTPPLLAVCLGLWFVGLDKGWILIVASLFLFPIGFIAVRFDKQVSQRDAEVASFLRSLGGTATSRGTTLANALASMKLDSFPTLQPVIRMLGLRLKSFGQPKLCWETFGYETGSLLAKQAVGIFYEAVNLGGDPDRSGKLTSMFSMKTALLRAQRQGVAATFSWLVIVMHVVLSGLMIFLLGILGQFAIRLNDAMQGLSQGGQAINTFGLQSMFSFNTPQVEMLGNVTITMIILLALINAFAIVGSEGSHLIKMTFYLSILLLVSGLCLLGIPPLVKLVM